MEKITHKKIVFGLLASVLLCFALVIFWFQGQQNILKTKETLLNQENINLKVQNEKLSEAFTSLPDDFFEKSNLYKNLARSYKPESLITSTNSIIGPKEVALEMNYRYTINRDDNLTINTLDSDTEKNGKVLIVFPKKFKTNTIRDGARFDSYNIDPETLNFGKDIISNYYFAEFSITLESKNLSKDQFTEGFTPENNGDCIPFTKFEVAEVCKNIPLGGEASITKTLTIVKDKIRFYIQINSFYLSPDEEQAIFNSIEFT